MKTSVPVAADAAHNALVATVQLYSEMLLAFQQNLDAVVARGQRDLEAATKNLDAMGRRCRELEVEVASLQTQHDYKAPL